ncbi:MAG TPA: putative integrase [bacterium]|nr:putative integrase [bacterium]
MSVLISTLKEELATALRLEKKYKEQLRSFPVGSFVVRQVRSKRYGYLTHRKEGKVRQHYLGPVDEEAIKGYRSSAEEKKRVKAKLKSVLDQITILKRALRGKAK